MSKSHTQQQADKTSDKPSLLSIQSQIMPSSLQFYGSCLFFESLDQNHDSNKDDSDSDSDSDSNSDEVKLDEFDRKIFNLGLKLTWLYVTPSQWTKVNFGFKYDTCFNAPQFKNMLSIKKSRFRLLPYSTMVHIFSFLTTKEHLTLLAFVSKCFLWLICQKSMYSKQTDSIVIQSQSQTQPQLRMNRTIEIEGACFTVNLRAFIQNAKMEKWIQNACLYSQSSVIRLGVWSECDCNWKRSLNLSCVECATRRIQSMTDRTKLDTIQEEMEQIREKIKKLRKKTEALRKNTNACNKDKIDFEMQNIISRKEMQRHTELIKALKRAANRLNKLRNEYKELTVKNIMEQRFLLCGDPKIKTKPYINGKWILDTILRKEQFIPLFSSAETLLFEYFKSDMELALDDLNCAIDSATPSARSYYISILKKSSRLKTKDGDKSQNREPKTRMYDLEEIKSMNLLQLLCCRLQYIRTLTFRAAIDQHIHELFINAACALPTYDDILYTKKDEIRTVNPDKPKNVLQTKQPNQNNSNKKSRGLAFLKSFLTKKKDKTKKKIKNPSPGQSQSNMISPKNLRIIPRSITASSSTTIHTMSLFSSTASNSTTTPILPVVNYCNQDIPNNIQNSLKYGRSTSQCSLCEYCNFENTKEYLRKQKIWRGVECINFDCNSYEDLLQLSKVIHTHRWSLRTLTIYCHDILQNEMQFDKWQNCIWNQHLPHLKQLVLVNLPISKKIEDEVVKFVTAQIELQLQTQTCSSLVSDAPCNNIRRCTHCKLIHQFVFRSTCNYSELRMMLDYIKYKESIGNDEAFDFGILDKRMIKKKLNTENLIAKNLKTRLERITACKWNVRKHMPSFKGLRKHKTAIENLYFVIQRKL